MLTVRKNGFASEGPFPPRTLLDIFLSSSDWRNS